MYCGCVWQKWAHFSGNHQKDRHEPQKGQAYIVAACGKSGRIFLKTAFRFSEGIRRRNVGWPGIVLEDDSDAVERENFGAGFP